MSDDTNREKVHTKIGNIEHLVKIKRISDTSSTMALEQTRSAISNGNKGVGEGRVI